MVDDTMLVRCKVDADDFRLTSVELDDVLQCDVGLSEDVDGSSADDFLTLRVADNLVFSLNSALVGEARTDGLKGVSIATQTTVLVV